MRLNTILAALAALAAILVALPQTVEAGVFHRNHAPRGWGEVRTVRHWVYYPRYQHRYYAHSYTDPYAYRYEPRGYYPYYNSGYWVPAKCYTSCKPRLKRPPYYKAWGATKRKYHHRRWHARHHGYIRRGHW